MYSWGLIRARPKFLFQTSLVYTGSVYMYVRTCSPQNSLFEVYEGFHGSKQGSSLKKIKEGGWFEIKGYLWFSDHIKGILPQKGGGSLPLWLDPWKRTLTYMYMYERYVMLLYYYSVFLE